MPTLKGMAFQEGVSPRSAPGLCTRCMREVIIVPIWQRTKGKTAPNSGKNDRRNKTRKG